MKTGNKRADGQMSGLAGEYFVAAELLKRGVQAAFTLGNAKAVDLHAHNASTGRNFNVQVKALRSKGGFLVSHDKIVAEHVYVFVLLNKPDEAVRYFVVSGEVLKASPQWFRGEPGFQDIYYKTFEEGKHESAWDVFLS